MDNPVVSTALGGALERRLRGGWHWKSGDAEPCARDMTLRDVAPNFRCSNRSGITYVEIPGRWVEARYWPDARPDEQAAQAIRELIKDQGQHETKIFAEGYAELVDDHRLSVAGYLIPAQAWDDRMCEVVGCWWDREHEAEIMARAAREQA